MEGLGVGPLTPSWRLITSGPGSGPWNMALDQRLMETVRAGGLPFLRFYLWSPSTLSLGRFQNPTAGLTDAARGVPRVRRATGGGAIWHDAELTYSLGCRQDHLGTRGVKASFEVLTGFLLDAWRAMGWPAEYAKDAPGPRDGIGTFTPACFAGTEEYDILVFGKKLGGNAQQRDRATIFQHGSLPFRLDHPRLATLFEPAALPAPEATTDLEACGWKGSTEELITVLAQAFQRRLGVVWTEEMPSALEQEGAQALVETRYGSGEWTENGGGSLRPF